MLLEHSINHHDPFERNQSDVFYFHNEQHIGDLAAVRIYHDDKGPGASWHLQRLEINDAVVQMSYFFPCNRWLSAEDDDRKVDRTLKCQQKRQKHPKHLKQPEANAQQPQLVR